MPSKVCRARRFPHRCSSPPFCPPASLVTNPAGLDTLIAAGEVAWAGVEPIGERDGRIALFLSDKLPLLAQPRPITDPLTEREEKLLAVLESTGASFFDPLHQAVGGGYPGESIDALWSLVWRGLVTNDSLHALRAYIATPGHGPHGATAANRGCLPLPPHHAPERPGPLVPARFARAAEHRRIAQLQPKSSHALALQLLNRYGVLLRESVAAENVPGGFSAVYDVLKALEESGRIRRGYFVAGLGATQFALPAAVDLLRQLRTAPPDREAGVRAARRDRSGQPLWLRSALARSAGGRRRFRIALLACSPVRPMPK